MKTKHTPGPWEVEHDCDGPIVTAEARNICEVELSHGDAEANARLIAAAPDLLAMLIDCCDTFSGEDEYLNGCSTRDMAQKCRAAIAKATGN